MPKISSAVRGVVHKTSVKLLLKSLIWAFALLGILFIILVVALIGFLRYGNNTTINMPSSAILQIDFDDPISEIRSDSLINDLTGEAGASFYDLLKSIAFAAGDDRIKAIVAHISQSELSLSQVEELRDIIAIFRQTGKKAYIFSESFGSFGGGMSEYYLATAFDKIILQPGGDVGITGISIEMPFVRKLLDRIGIEPEFYARHEYKNAYAAFTDDKMSQALKEELNKLGGSMFSQMVADIAASRDISSQALLSLIDKAPLSAQEAVNSRLVDELSYQNNLYAKIEQEHDAEIFDWLNYLYFLAPAQGKQSVGILTVAGEITPGKSVFEPLQGEVVSGAETFVASLKELEDIKDLKALLIRIDSPGGSYLAADYMRQALVDFKAKKQIPVVVSMSSYAASGGYFIALPADVIMAQDLSITGSIGVLGGKPVLSGLWQALDVNWQSVSFGKNSGIMSLNHPFSATEKKLFNQSLDKVYADFVAKTAQARKISLKKMDTLARGRVWTGAQAKSNGLIDAIGGYNEALAKALELAGLDMKSPIRLEFYPRPKTMQEKISELFLSTPKIMANKLKINIGLDKDLLNVLQRLKYDAVLPPIKFQY